MEATYAYKNLLILYIKMNVCLYVSLYLIQIHISEPIGTTLCTRLPIGLEETVGYVWARNSWPLRILGPFSLGGQDGCRRYRFPRYPYIRGSSLCSRNVTDMLSLTAVIRGSLISVILAGVPLTSRKLHSSRRQSHPPQRRIPYSGGCSRHATDITFYRAAGPSATALYPSF
jgi:hypothetical protein